MKISACMIVKNESGMISDCLESIDWADEIIVVDTGSSDNTPNVAKSMGAEVYYHEWEDDFSLHRNQSINYCTGDWFFIIDADERISLSINKKYISDYFKNIPKNVSALFATFKEYDGNEFSYEWSALRFFRRKDFIKFDKCVHNEPMFNNKSSAIEILKFHHLGYSLDDIKMMEKLNRTHDLLSKRIMQNEYDHVAYLYMMQTLFCMKRYNDVKKYADLYLKYSKKNNERKFDFIYYIYSALNYIEKKSFKKALRLCKKGLKKYPLNADLNYIMIDILHSLNKKYDKYTNQYLLSIMEMENKKTFELMNLFSSKVHREKIRSLLRL